MWLIIFCNFGSYWGTSRKKCPRDVLVSTVVVLVVYFYYHNILIYSIILLLGYPNPIQGTASPTPPLPLNGNAKISGAVVWTYKLAAPRSYIIAWRLPFFNVYVTVRLLRQNTGGACLYMQQDGHWLASFEVMPPPQKLVFFVFPRPKK